MVSLDGLMMTPDEKYRLIAISGRKLNFDWIDGRQIWRPKSESSINFYESAEKSTIDAIFES